MNPCPALKVVVLYGQGFDLLSRGCTNPQFAAAWFWGCLGWWHSYLL